MIISAIVAMNNKFLIGSGSKLPWWIPRDMYRFSLLTMDKGVVMGRRTFDSLPHALPERMNVVLTSGQLPISYNIALARNVHEAIDIAAEYSNMIGQDEIIIMGGSMVYAATCSLWHKIYLTIVDGDFDGDVYFPIYLTDSMFWTTEDVKFRRHGKSVRHKFVDLHLSREGKTLREIVVTSGGSSD